MVNSLARTVGVAGWRRRGEKVAGNFAVRRNHPDWVSVDAGILLLWYGNVTSQIRLLVLYCTTSCSPNEEEPGERRARTKSSRRQPESLAQFLAHWPPPRPFGKNDAILVTLLRFLVDSLLSSYRHSSSALTSRPSSTLLSPLEGSEPTQDV